MGTNTTNQKVSVSTHHSACHVANKEMEPGYKYSACKGQSSVTKKQLKVLSCCSFESLPAKFTAPVTAAQP